ncbi:hypothetical protein SDC9_164308 [bioreactor metagenome]|uniref:ABC-2 type transporter transmembrane domain-containing protein n=1 Tax=bioreactor metagenome TaxID=1076179 RepID=A0A645FU02_9ZZZZ
MMLAIPVVQLLLFGYAINSEPRHLPTALLVQEDSVFARSITAALKNSAYFDLVAQARTPGELDEMVRRGEVQFAITIPGDFTRRVARGDQAQILVDVDATDPSATGAAVAALAALPAQTIKPTLEYDAKAHELKGPLIIDVLKAAGVKAGDGQSVLLRALDGYAVAVPMAEIQQRRFIFATHIDGQPLALGGLGPLWAVFDADRSADMAVKPLKQRFALCPWGTYHVEVAAI